MQRFRRQSAARLGWRATSFFCGDLLERGGANNRSPKRLPATHDILNFAYHAVELALGKTMGMTARQLEAFCSRWPGVTRDIKWESNLVFSVGGKMFAMTPVDGGDGGRLWCKVPDARFLELTDQPGIMPAPYLARAHWISIIEPRRFITEQLQAFIHDAYVLVRGRLTKKMQAALGPLPTVEV